MSAPLRPTVVDLPLATRDALVRLLLAELASPAGSGALDEVLHALEVTDHALDAATPDVHSVLAAAGLAAGGKGAPVDAPGVVAPDLVTLRDAARRRLQGYRAALAAAPRGTDVETRLMQARALLAHALFFEVHEILEPPWRAAVGAERLLLQGLIQAAVAWHHAARGRSGPARRAAAAAAAKLAAAPSPWRGFPIAALRTRLDADRAALARGEVITSARVLV